MINYGLSHPKLCDIELKEPHLFQHINMIKSLNLIGCNILSRIGNWNKH